jgi:hypothetical protein
MTFAQNRYNVFPSGLTFMKFIFAIIKDGMTFAKKKKQRNNVFFAVLTEL